MNRHSGSLTSHLPSISGTQPECDIHTLKSAFLHGDRVPSNTCIRRSTSSYNPQPFFQVTDPSLDVVGPTACFACGSEELPRTGTPIILISTAGSLTSSRRPESSYRDSSNDDCSTPSPDLQESSHDKYTPTRPSTTVYSTFSTRSNHSDDSRDISVATRAALVTLCSRIYELNCHCLVTHTKVQQLLEATHLVQRKSHPDLLTLYEFCLGLDFKTFHVDSRRNIFYLDITWHQGFNSDLWFLLPDTDTLEQVRDHVTEAITWRAESKSRGIDYFRSKWKLKSKTRYTLIPLSEGTSYPFVRKNAPGVVYLYPYLQLLPLECHVAPPFAVINAGPKCKEEHIDAIMRGYCAPDLEMTNAKDAAKAWEAEKVGKRKRDCDEDDMERHNQRSKRTTRSHSARGGTPKSNPPRNTTGDQPPSRIRKCKWSPGLSGAPLTDHAVLHLRKLQKVDLNTRVERWVKESTQASLGLEPSPCTISHFTHSSG
ncbi:hypothetical protein DFH29DRAFT_1079226 [Suillus ampliporus]|nr:hypothetical protein DFH29DRAFT_1079226 [Suillus ampliporus]